MEPVEMILDNTNPINQEIHIEVPDGYEIDRENSTFECIRIKPIIKTKFSDYDCTYPISGYFVYDGTIVHFPGAPNGTCHKDVFASEKQAKSALAMAQISQILLNDERFGGVVTDEEWDGVGPKYDNWKYCIIREKKNTIRPANTLKSYCFLAFHTREQRDLFLKEYEQLVKDYLMVE